MPSLLQATIFHALCFALDQYSTEQSWEEILCNQVYPSPNILLNDSTFANEMSRLEPGPPLIYPQIQEGTMRLCKNADITTDQRLLLKKQCNDLLNAHHNFIHALAHVQGYFLFINMIDRFYGQVADQPFHSRFAPQIARMQKYSWPRYEVLKYSMTSRLDNEQINLINRHHSVLQIKNSPTTKAFLQYLDIAVKKSTPDGHSCTNLSTTNHSPAVHTDESIQTLLARRKGLIARRNLASARARVKKNQKLKEDNVSNIHQTGEQGRHPMSDRMIAAMSAHQQAFVDKMNDVTRDDLHEYKEVLEQQGLAEDEVEMRLESALAVLARGQEMMAAEGGFKSDYYTNIAKTVGNDL